MTTVSIQRDSIVLEDEVTRLVIQKIVGQIKGWNIVGVEWFYQFVKFEKFFFMITDSSSYLDIGIIIHEGKSWFKEIIPSAEVFNC